MQKKFEDKCDKVYNYGMGTGSTNFQMNMQQQCHLTGYAWSNAPRAKNTTINKKKTQQLSYDTTYQNPQTSLLMWAGVF